MNIKLIASDLDGTLLTTSKELSPETQRVLNEAVKKDIHIVPATGRSYQAVPDVIKKYPGIEYIITANGGAVYSVRENNRIYQCLLKPESVGSCCLRRYRILCPLYKRNQNSHKRYLHVCRTT